MNNMPAPDQKITVQEAAESIAELAQIVHQYPIGQTWDASITLNDEQWLAVATAVGAIIVHHSVDGSPNPFPEWIDQRLREALGIIWKANMRGVIENAGVK